MSLVDLFVWQLLTLLHPTHPQTKKKGKKKRGGGGGLIQQNKKIFNKFVSDNYVYYVNEWMNKDLTRK